ncbi:hypothetical protein C8Q70DRAFT_194831 [Cubamyces menziesii]|nr:hypothetical protein C8Q70DRAFT_194831 [Cubamyces menziesii]
MPPYSPQLNPNAARQDIDVDVGGHTTFPAMLAEDTPRDDRGHLRHDGLRFYGFSAARSRSRPPASRCASLLFSANGRPTVSAAHWSSLWLTRFADGLAPSLSEMNGFDATGPHARRARDARSRCRDLGRRWGGGARRMSGEHFPFLVREPRTASWRRDSFVAVALDPGTPDLIYACRRGHMACASLASRNAADGRSLESPPALATPSTVCRRLAGRPPRAHPRSPAGSRHQSHHLRPNEQQTGSLASADPSRALRASRHDPCSLPCTRPEQLSLCARCPWGRSRADPETNANADRASEVRCAEVIASAASCNWAALPAAWLVDDRGCSCSQVTDPLVSIGGRTCWSIRFRIHTSVGLGLLQRGCRVDVRETAAVCVCGVASPAMPRSYGCLGLCVGRCRWSCAAHECAEQPRSFSPKCFHWSRRDGEMRVCA